MIRRLVRCIEGLEVTQGTGLGALLKLFPWERRFIRGAFAPDVATAGLSVARGNGKSTLLGAVAAATRLQSKRSSGAARCASRRRTSWLRSTISRTGTSSTQEYGIGA